MEAKIETLIETFERPRQEDCCTFKVGCLIFLGEFQGLHSEALSQNVNKIMDKTNQQTKYQKKKIHP